MRPLLLALLLVGAGAGCTRTAPLSETAKAKMDPALAALYQAHRQREPAPDGVMTVGDAVAVEATAMRDGAATRADLEAVGLTSASVAGVLVNGLLPVDALGKAAALASVRALRPVPPPPRRPVPVPERH